MRTYENNAKLKAAARQVLERARRGDRVTIRTPHGQTRRGRVVFNEGTHLVLNGGGPHGTPLIATERNIV